MAGNRDGWGFYAVVPCIFSFVASLGTYWLGLYVALTHQKNITLLYATPSKSYEAALARLRYSYFNTNPVYVLMSEHCRGMGLPRTTWYEVGKAHLQAVDPRAHARLAAEQAVAEQKPPKQLIAWLLYEIQLWFAGAPKHTYTTLGDLHE
eukprot:TRINITY_DN20867_c0_g1_i1.p1 TRINITY_DN20867_c0_g1~~TRINITY_DN20867_c0_g1_i1.p1  ORF type:complete len:150 (-),score=24.65 TRINITY_DN20867_c0_g1_i1:590-1039(-)